LLVGFSVALLAAGAAIIVGLISGWFPLADKVIMRVVDGMLAIPTLLLAIAVMVIFGPTVINVIGVLALGAVPSGSRVARAAVLSQKNQAFVEAARALGAPTSRIMSHHVVPNMIAPMAVVATVNVAGAILAEASLAFLGAGIDPGFPTWGNMMGEARAYMSRHSWMMFWPGMAITLVVLAFAVGGDVLRDVMDPRLRGSEQA
jgi:peptide/nickel transport system permease protein